MSRPPGAHHQLHPVPGNTAAGSRQETHTMNRERVIYVLVGIALGMYVVPRVRAKIGY